jgi:hypothetical protein
VLIHEECLYTRYPNYTDFVINQSLQLLCSPVGVSLISPTVFSKIIPTPFSTIPFYPLGKYTAGTFAILIGKGLHDFKKEFVWECRKLSLLTLSYDIMF